MEFFFKEVSLISFYLEDAKAKYHLKSIFISFSCFFVFKMEDDHANWFEKALVCGDTIVSMYFLPFCFNFDDLALYFST